MTTEELIAAGLPIDPAVESAEQAAPAEDSVRLVVLVVAKMGRFGLTAAKTSEMWMPVSTI
jgi:hypothetical protein